MRKDLDAFALEQDIYKEKLLSIVVPSYNAEWCLGKCLESFITVPFSNRIEVIVVNDGSTDDTLKIAQRYVNDYPSVFQVIDKSNKGHGSGINAAAKLATGKYFKVVDADDWLITENLLQFIDILSKTNADVIITHFHTVDMNNGKKQKYQTRDIELNKVYSLAEYVTHKGGAFTCSVLHGITYRTNVYRESGTVLSEGIFYEDQEYVVLPFLAVRTVLPLDLFLYQYMIGNESQSISDRNIVNRLMHLEKVIRTLFLFYLKHPDMSLGASRYVTQIITNLLPYYYIAAMIKNPDKPKGRHRAALFRKELEELVPEFTRRSDFQFKMIFVMNRFHFSGWLLRKLKSKYLYRLFCFFLKKNKNAI